MSIVPTATTDGAPTPPVPTPLDVAEKQGDPAALGDAGKRALHAERTAREEAERERDRFRAEAEQLRQASETEAQRIQRERDEATTRASQAEARATRYEAAAEAGLPLTWAARLVGSTPAELAADAAKLAAELGAARPNTPRPDPSQGHGDRSGSRPASVSQAMDDYRASRRSKQAS